MTETIVKIDEKMAQLLANLKKVDQATRDTAWDCNQQASLEMEAQIKEQMPVDTGRARASWGHFTPDDLTGRSKRIGKYRTGKRVRYRTAKSAKGEVQIASAADAIWIEDEAKGVITQGTEVGYVEYLNAGHSRQAPENFITDAETRFQAKFASLFGSQIGRTVADVLSGKQTFRVRTTTGKRITVTV